MSILSFPERGPWGDHKYRGNCSGHVYRELYKGLGLQSGDLVVDPMCGSGTSIEVAQSMGLRAIGLDLKHGFDATSMSILSHLPEEAHLVFSHPPYHDMVVYSGEVWGEPDERDLSRSGSIEEFVDRLERVLINQRHATRPGGHYGLLIGDLRRDGLYHSFQATCLTRMPASELKAVLIKQQHHTRSSQTHYRNFKYWRIMHEYLMVWQKPELMVFWVNETLNQHRKTLQSSWRNVVVSALMQLGGEASLSALYQHLEKTCLKVKNRQHWKAKVRQTLQLHPHTIQLSRGHWKLAHPN